MSRDGDLASMMNFVLSNEGLILLGSQQAVDEIVTKLTEERRVINSLGGSMKNVLQRDSKLPEVIRSNTKGMSCRSILSVKKSSSMKKSSSKSLKHKSSVKIAS